MLTKTQIQKRLKCEASDAAEVLAIQAKGKVHGVTGRTFATDDDFESEVGMDIDHVEMIAMLDEGSVRAIYDAAVREGAAASRKKKAA